MASARAGADYVRDDAGRRGRDGRAEHRLRAGGRRRRRRLSTSTRTHLVTLAEQATGEWSYGEERYSRQLQERERLDYDARSLREHGPGGVRPPRRRDAGAGATGHVATEDWGKVLDEANEDHPRTEEEMRRAYAEWTETSRQFLAETGLVTLPEGESCSVEPRPSSPGRCSRSRPTADRRRSADRAAGPLLRADRARRHVSEEEIQKRLALEPLRRHPDDRGPRGVPGPSLAHHLEQDHAPQLRLVLGTPFFSEGWALYAERVMRERGFFTDPIQELYHLEATIFRAARIVVDTSLHMGEMTHDEAVEFMVGARRALTEPTARSEVGRYCSWPTQASAYLTGCLEILRITRPLPRRARGAGQPAARRDPDRRAARLPRHAGRQRPAACRARPRKRVMAGSRRLVRGSFSGSAATNICARYVDASPSAVRNGLLRPLA